MSIEKNSEKGWKCSSCGLKNSDVVSKCQACFTNKMAKQRLNKRYQKMCDEDLVEIIMKCDEYELKQIRYSLEYENAVYQNHSFLSLLIDIGRINLIFLLFQKGYKFAMNYAPSNIINDDNKTKQEYDEYEDEEDIKKQSKDEIDIETEKIYVDKNEILPLSMAFERDEKYLIKLLLKKGASPNQCTKQENLSLNYKWFDLSTYEIYLHYLPISIPIRKMIDDPIFDITEYEEIFNLLISNGALWYEDEYMFLFCNKDASFWIDFLSNYNYRTERYLIHNAMRKYYKNIIKPLIIETPLHECEYIIKQYFITFPMIDTDQNNDDNDKKTASDDDNDDYYGNHRQRQSVSLSEIQDINNDNADDEIEPIKLNDIYAKILSIKRSDEENNENNTLCKQYEYTIINENDVTINVLVHDERLWKELEVNDVIHIKNAILLCISNNNNMKHNERLTHHDGGTYDAIPIFKIAHSMTLTPSISVIHDEKIKEKFQNGY